MKKLFYSLFILAMTAMTFTSCEDVPAPFDIPFSTDDPNAVVIDPAGSGTLADPYNVAAVIAFTQQLEPGTESTQDIYFKGKVVSIDENYTTQYGNAKFYVSDDGTANNRFLVYRALYLGNKKYTSGDLLNEGDEVIICGKVTNYNGTLETQQNKAFLYSLNGKTEGGGGSDTPAGDAKGSGTLADPYNPVGAAAAVKNLTWTSNDTYDTTGDVYMQTKEPSQMAAPMATHPSTSQKTAQRMANSTASAFFIWVTRSSKQARPTLRWATRLSFAVS